MEGLILVAIVWGIFSAITKAAKKAQGGATPPARPSAPSPDRTEKPWQQMMGGSFGNLLEQLEKLEKNLTEVPQTNAPKVYHPQPVRPVAQPAARPAPLVSRLRTDMDDYVSGEGAASREGFDDCHEPMLTGPKAQSEPAYASAVPGFSMKFDQDALMQGVVYAEILARRTPRRRVLR